MYLKPTEEVDCVVFKEDRGDVYIMLRFEDWLSEKKKNEELNNLAGKDLLEYIRKKK